MQTRLILRLTIVASVSASVALLLMVTSDMSMTHLPGTLDNDDQDDVDDIQTTSEHTNIDDVLWFQHSSVANDQAPFHPFVDGQPKSVIILTYQRSGSSFVGQMFNSNPSAFYMFEPLDALYSALYGTSQGWNVPSDITAFGNGSQRSLPKSELAAVASFLRSIYTCDVDSLPVESLAHRYWSQFRSQHDNSADYVRCLQRCNVTLAPCLNHTARHCGRRFGERSPERLVDCNRLLWSDKYRANYPDVDTRRQFQLYRQCRADLRSKVESRCVSLLRSNCSSRPLRAVKSVRATMDAMEPLLRTLPNFRVIHLIRDPRAVALSRIEFDVSVRGLYTSKAGADKLVTEASLYCRTVARDVVSRHRLMRIYPNRIYSLMYDDVVRNVARHTRNVYRFMDERLPAKTLTWIGSNGRRKRNGTTIATRWKDKLTVRQNEQILSVCSELFERLRLAPDVD